MLRAHLCGEGVPQRGFDDRSRKGREDKAKTWTDNDENGSGSSKNDNNW
jgi:hypothetical protein